jgi:hypothetical protein
LSFSDSTFVWHDAAFDAVKKGRLRLRRRGRSFPVISQPVRLRAASARLQRQAGIVPDGLQAPLPSLSLGTEFPCSPAKMADGIRRRGRG